MDKTATTILIQLVILCCITCREFLHFSACCFISLSPFMPEAKVAYAMLVSWQSIMHMGIYIPWSLVFLLTCFIHFTG